MRTVQRFAFVGLLGLMLAASACGDDDNKSPATTTKADGGAAGPSSFDNYQACKNWVASLKCGSFDASITVPCESYKQVTTCDVSSYFDCLTANFKCTSGMPDPSGWSQCASKATCK